jgi:hypothetical protein
VLKVDVLRREAERLQALFDEFLNLTGPCALQRSRVDLNIVVARLVEFCEPLLSANHIRVTVGAASFKYFRNTMVRDLTSMECMAEVVEKLGLLKDAERNRDGTPAPESIRERDSLARSLGSNLSISTTSPCELVDIVKITYTGTDRAIGKDLVDQVKKTYIRARWSGFMSSWWTSATISCVRPGSRWTKSCGRNAKKPVWGWKTRTSTRRPPERSP